MQQPPRRPRRSAGRASGSVVLAGWPALAAAFALTLPILPVPAAGAEPAPARAAALPVPGPVAPTAPVQSPLPPPQALPALPDPIRTPSLQVPRPDKVLVEALALAGKRLVAGGLNGLLIVSDDNGASWRQVQLPVSVTLTAIRFADARTGWAVGHFGAVLRTGDAGEHWSLVQDNAGAARITLEAAQIADAADSVRDRMVRAATTLLQTDPSRPFLLIQTAGPDTVRLIGADALSIESLDGGSHWLPWSAAIDNPGKLQLNGMAERDGVVIAAGTHGLLLAGRPADGLHALKSPFDGTVFGVLDGGRAGIILFGQQGQVFATRDPFGRPGTAMPKWSRIDDPSPTTLTAGLLRQDGSTLLGDASGATWRVEGKPDELRLVPAGPQAPFPILAIAEAADRSLILAGAGGVIRVPAEAHADAAAAHEAPR